MIDLATEGNEFMRFSLPWENITAGNHMVTFDAQDKGGNPLPLNVYDTGTNGELIPTTRPGYALKVEKTPVRVFPPEVLMSFPLDEFVLTNQSQILLSTRT